MTIEDARDRILRTILEVSQDARNGLEIHATVTLTEWNKVEGNPNVMTAGKTLIIADDDLEW